MKLLLLVITIMIVFISSNPKFERRLINEIENMNKIQSDEIAFEYPEENNRHWTVVIKGPVRDL